MKKILFADQLKEWLLKNFKQGAGAYPINAARRILLQDFLEIMYSSTVYTTAAVEQLVIFMDGAIRRGCSIIPDFQYELNPEVFRFQ